MLQRLIRLAANQPDLLADHAGAYAELAAAEAAVLAQRLRRQALLMAVALAAVAVAVTLAGVAALLWSALPLATMPTPWLLLVVPALPLLLALVCAWAAQTPAGTQAFAGLQRQWQADVAMLRQAGAAP